MIVRCHVPTPPWNTRDRISRDQGPAVHGYQGYGYHNMGGWVEIYTCINYNHVSPSVVLCMDGSRILSGVCVIQSSVID